MKKSMADETKG